MGCGCEGAQEKKTDNTCIRFITGAFESLLRIMPSGMSIRRVVAAVLLSSLPVCFLRSRRGPVV